MSNTSEQDPSATAERRFVLPDDVVFVPAAELSQAMRASLGGEDGDVAVTRPGYRVPSRLVDRDTAALLQSFQPPCSIAEAILRFCRPRGLAPEQTLDAAFGALQVFASSRILVPEGSPDAAPLHASWSPGQCVGGLEIVELLQHTYDTEVYRARLASGGHAVLKLARRANAQAIETIEREAVILHSLAGCAVPRLLGSGSLDGRPHLLLEWIDGVAATTRAARIRGMRHDGWRSELHRLVTGVVGAYATLHEAGVVHADVHGRNVLIGPGDCVTLIDFGLARRLDHDPLGEPTRRGGFVGSLDPQTAQALLDGRPPAPVDAAGEQYAIATLVYELVTGASYLEPASRADATQRQIVREPPLAFARHGVSGWDDTERVVRRALSKRPADRFSSVRALHAALESAGAPTERGVDRAFETFARAYVDRFVATLDPRHDAPSRLRAPAASVDQGAAGVAWLLLRVGMLRDDPRALASADLWVRRAAARLAEGDAFHTPPKRDDGFSIDDCSLVHRAPGVHFVAAMVCLSRADHRGLAERVDAFVASVGRWQGAEDLTLGRAGVLCTMVALLEASRRLAPFVTARLTPLARGLLDELSALVHEDQPPGLLARQPLSMAHGWVGLLHALLRAGAVLEVPPTEVLRERVAQVVGVIDAAFTEPHTAGDVPGWCNGAAGQLALLVEAHRTFGEPGLLATARVAGLRAAVHPDRHGHLCCGLSGRVFALLDLHRYTGERRWLDEARRLARVAAGAPMPRDATNPIHALFWGRAGVALAIEEARAPEWAAMPLFGSWSWSKAVAQPEPSSACTSYRTARSTAASYESP